ncbi:hypothetical protein BKA56DRAFT_614044 [Ilyonectria sp. MPI-CAGE-AT-0026]|nr:hypothetical protein BKA56DRAFT_614044 [Ilyonectria sp. MPI-CAGE-AT-0026]
MAEIEGIAHLTKRVKQGFRDAISAIQHIPTRFTEGTALIASIEDARERFLLWAGNVGALNHPEARLSLEHRLRDLPEVLEQIWKYLGELREALDELHDLVSDGSPVDRNYGPKDYLAEGEEDGDEGHEPGIADDEYTQELLGVISEYLSTLFRIARIIRTATARDRYDRALQYSNAAFLDQFDLDYVKTRYPKLNDYDVLARRLGRAITDRRKFIKYSRDHGDRLDASESVQIGLPLVTSKQQPEDPVLDTTDPHSTIRGVAATSVQDPADSSTKQSSKATTLLPAKVINNLAVPAEDDDNVSFVSASTSFNTEGSVLTLPSLDDISQGKPEFECPICRIIQYFHKPRAWKTHAFRDLKAYLCTASNSKDCDRLAFPDRTSWFQHELQHRVHYSCTLCDSGPYPSRKSLMQHLTDEHCNLSEPQLRVMVDAGKEAPSYLRAVDCPFCTDWAEALSKNTNSLDEDKSEAVLSVRVSPTRFKVHVASHLEQLAIFAIPRSLNPEGSSPSSAADCDSLRLRMENLSEMSTVHSNPDLNSPLYQGSDVNSQEGEDGTALQAASASGQEDSVHDDGVDVNALGGHDGNAGTGDGVEGGNNGSGADDSSGDIAAAKPKKKKGKDELDVGLPSIPTADFSADAFDEIKLGDDLLSDPAFDVSVDFNSQEGFYEMAKKKKGSAAKQSLPPPPPPVPPPPPADEGNKGGGAGGDSNGGDAAGGAGAGGDGGNGADAGWGDFATAKPKKKKGKDELDLGLPSIPTADFSADAFDEIKLGDDLGGKLDLGLGPPDGKGFGSWGTKWNSGAGGGAGDAGGGAGGGSSWDWSGAGGNDPITATADVKIDESSWGINRGKPKKAGKSSLSFGEFGDVEEHTEVANPDEKEDPWGFGAKKDTKKKKDPSIWGSDPIEEKKDLIGEPDLWGWGTSKKKPPPEPVPAKKETEDIWDTWGISKKDRTKKKGIIDDSSELPMPAPDPPPLDDLWGGDGWSKMDKKKSSIWDDPTTQDNDKNEDDDFWNAFGNKKKSPVPEVLPPPGEKPADETLAEVQAAEAKAARRAEKIAAHKEAFAAEAEAARIAKAEEAELAALKAKKTKKGKLGRKDTERFNMLSEASATRAAEQAAQDA